MPVEVEELAPPASVIAPADPPIGTFTMTNHGGPVVSSPNIVVITLGTWWGDTPHRDQYINELINNGYLSGLSAYGVTNAKFAGIFNGPSVVNIITDQLIQDTLTTILPAFPEWPQPSPNTVYVLLLPAGANTDTTCSSNCGYHTSFVSPIGQIFYAVIPDVSCPLCLFQNNPFNTFSMVFAHELTEIVTDPVVGTGWFDTNTTKEVADVVAWLPKQYGPWTVQGYWTNAGGNTVGSYIATSIPVITSSPTNTTVSPGSTVTFTASATGNPSPSVIWQVSVNDGAFFTTIDGATSTTYTFTAQITDTQHQYRAVFFNTLGATPTSSAILIVTSPPVQLPTTSSTIKGVQSGIIDLVLTRPQMRIVLPGGPSKTASEDKPPFGKFASDGGYMNSPVDDFHFMGTFWRGDSLPYISIQVSYITGGYVDISNCIIECSVKLFDPVRKRSLGDELTSFVATITDPKKGLARLDWFSSDPAGEIDLEEGYYLLQANLQFQDGRSQHTSRATFKVQEL